ncbi:TetR/AcrR family transcriptional regulator [Chryseobacterium indoltheticum]|uniref:TetR/AcrR family transcriptional regulator n=1 Tax=Chryseobacterium indoltheticum TaxID=254 RepID=UPI003F499D9F
MGKKFSEKQIHILDIAEELIAKKGYEGTSVRDICTKANINVAMISYYFGSKEKMMSYLYQYRVLKTRENFSEFADTIKDGRPEMQMKEMIKYIVSQLFRYNYFHGFVTQELRHTENLKDELLDFYQLFVRKLDEVIKKGSLQELLHLHQSQRISLPQYLVLLCLSSETKISMSCMFPIKMKNHTPKKPKKR